MAGYLLSMLVTLRFVHEEALREKPSAPLAEPALRLAALTANPRNWHREVRSWGRSNARHRHTGNGIPVPDRNTEYYFYQSLVASWEGPPTPAYIARMEAHMVKAAREAKVRTSWTRIDETYESSLGAFVRTTLNRRRSAAFIKRLDDFVRKLEPLAAASSLGLLTLKVLAPGIPDFFQGSERPLHSLTDPDNRRPVDYGRAESLAAAGRGTLPGLTDPGAKLWLTMSLLRLRKEHPDLFAEGSYQPLAASGPAAGSLFAFERRKSEERCIVIVMTRPGNLVDSDGAVRDGALDGTLIETGERGTWVDQLTGARFTSSGPLAAGDVLAAFPVAVLAHAGDRAGG
jgi:(1->4)-alpha-D-glucan 1-alpha-D-glucosylmutase